VSFVTRDMPTLGHRQEVWLLKFHVHSQSSELRRLRHSHVMSMRQILTFASNPCVTR